jgi:hypothetical protein
MPFSRVEFHLSRCNQLLESPSSLEPVAILEVGSRLVRSSRNIRKIGQAYLSVLVPLIHAIDSLGKFGTARLIDAAGIGPKVR